MKKLIRVLLGLVALVVVLFIVAVAVASFYFDPNDFKDQMSAAVKENTGRDLSIAGDIELSLFPWLGVQVGQVTLGNASGFPEPVFASAEKTQIRVKLLPLLTRQLEMDTLTLHGLTLKLARDEQGRTNWEDLTAPKEDA